MRYLILSLGLLSVLMLIFSIYYKSKFDNANTELIKLQSIREIELAEFRLEYERQMSLIKSFEEKRVRVIERYKAYDDIKVNGCDEKVRAIEEIQRVFYGR